MAIKDTHNRDTIGSRSNRLNTSDFLQQLIGTGPDASLNLFKINIVPLNNEDLKKFESLSFRTTQFITPKKDSVVAQIPYQNTTITIPTSGTQIDRSMTIPMRVDAKMSVMSLLRKYQLIKDTLGNYERDENKKLTLSVISMDSTFEVSGVYKWTFYNCYITSVSQLTYDYNSSNTGNVNVTFIYSYFDEG